MVWTLHTVSRNSPFRCFILILWLFACMFKIEWRPVIYIKGLMICLFQITLAAMYVKTSSTAILSPNRLSHFGNWLNLLRSCFLHNIYLTIYVKKLRISPSAFDTLHFSTGLTDAVLLPSLKLVIETSAIHCYRVDGDIVSYVVRGGLF